MTANVLIVDDTPENLQLLVGMLSEQQYNARAASNGRRALETVQEELPDLILLDILMPGMNGYEVCERLKANERTRDIPVLFISALNDTFDKVKAFSVGAVDYITKPFRPEEVLARIETHLALWNLQKSLQKEVCRRKQAEEELRECNRQLQESNQQLHACNQQLEEANACKDKFFAILAHDLRAPFNSLLVLPQIILEDIETYSKDDIKSMINQIYTSSETIYALLTNLLEWSRLERGLIECEPDVLVLLKIVERNMDLFASISKQKQVTLRHRIQQGFVVYADENMVDTVMRNLLSNALKFTGAGESVEVTASRNVDMVEIAVSDTGVGIPPEKIESLFRLGVKSSTRGTAGEKGTGLGLILCQELVEKNGGTIRVESKPGKGTMVAFTVPAKSVQVCEGVRSVGRNGRDYSMPRKYRKGGLV